MFITKAVVATRVGLNSNFEFESAHELLMILNWNSTFAKPMNFNLNLVSVKSMNFNLNVLIKHSMYLIFSNQNLHVKVVIYKLVKKTRNRSEHN